VSAFDVHDEVFFSVAGVRTARTFEGFFTSVNEVMVLEMSNAMKVLPTDTAHKLSGNLDKEEETNHKEAQNTHTFLNNNHNIDIHNVKNRSRRGLESKCRLFLCTHACK
jgi:hypothetical protein